MSAIDEGGVWCGTCLHQVHNHRADGCRTSGCACTRAYTPTPTRTPTPKRGDFLRALAEVEDGLDPLVTLTVTTSVTGAAYADVLIIGAATPAARIAALAAVAGQLAVAVDTFTAVPSTEDGAPVHVKIATRWRNIRLTLTTIAWDVPAVELDGLLAPLHALTPPAVNT
ncbi:hypothetical protein [Frankia sp. AgB32]|uniref:hypothetical protein n=1 Tax=Frankia sp. AgB32 TaxID=631119 RepID=UPI00200C08D9|nr:hypothetical protein [Frankia sp. AgB32]MCK9894711.1 hypothetical protein [Frankia sp. AgB32]